MFLLVPAHPGCTGENPERGKMLVMVVVVLAKLTSSDMKEESQLVTYAAGPVKITVDYIIV